MTDLDDNDLPAARPVRDSGIKTLLRIAELHALKSHIDFSIHFVAGRYHVVFGTNRRIFADEGHDRLRPALIAALEQLEGE